MIAISAVSSSMRVAIYVAVLVACIAAAPELTRTALASASAVLFETLPYMATAAMLAPLLGRFAPTVVAYAGCGCGRGPGARSIPAAVACVAMFGPYVGLTRWIAAIAVSLLQRDAAHDDHVRVPLLGDLAQLAPAALIAGVITVAAPGLRLEDLPPFLQLAAGAGLGFAASPCTLGSIAIASALRATSPLAAGAMLCVAGIIDLRVWRNRHETQVRRDSIAYALLAGASAIVAYEHGAMLVHPRMTLPLWACAAFCAYLGLRSTAAPAASQRFISALLLVAVLIGSPAPPAVATEIAMDDLYPGERIEFLGRYVADEKRPRVVRYAITCCRADARPVAIQLAQPVCIASGIWIRVSGRVQRRDADLVVHADGIATVAPPVDPFVYL